MTDALFEQIHCWICESVADYVYQQRLKYSQVKITKNASTSKNYVILTKRVKVQHDMKPPSNVKSMQIADLEQTSTKFIEIFVPDFREIYESREMHRRYVQADTLLFIRYC